MLRNDFNGSALFNVDGTHIITLDQGIYNINLNQMPFSHREHGQLIPAIGGDYFLALKNNVERRGSVVSSKPRTISVFDRTNYRRLGMSEELEEFKPSIDPRHRRDGSGRISESMRVLFFQKLGKLVTLPKSDDRVLIRDFAVNL